MRTSEETKDLYAALIKAQAEFKVALRETAKDFTKKNYADFQSVVEAARPSLAKYELGFMQMPLGKEGGLFLITRIFHVSGQFAECEMPIKIQKDDLQGIGAAITYMKRYQLQAMLGIVSSDEDSDAEKAMRRGDPDRHASKADTAAIMKAFSGIGVSEGKVLDYLGISKAELTEEHLTQLKAIGTEIKRNRAALEMYFPKDSNS